MEHLRAGGPNPPQSRAARPSHWPSQNRANRVQSARIAPATAARRRLLPSVRMVRMAQASAPAGRPAVSDGSALPVVRVEVRAGKAKPTVYEVGDGGFLVGGVPGCDLRLPGPNLPPVLCLIARQPRGASLRKLAP